MTKVFLHVDLDAFFASVEQLDHPKYRGKPVIVGGLPTDRRSVVSTASYEARKFGVHSAMPVFQALKLCPNGIFIRPNMHRYHEKSEEVMAIFKNYSPDIQQISVDEAFIDISGTERLFGPAEETAKKLKQEVFEKTGLTVSVGLASTKYCAKIASALQKPDGLTIVPQGKETEFMLSLPITKVWGAGKKTLEKLENYGIRTTGDIYKRSENLLQSLFGKAAGTFLFNAVRGNESEDFHADPKSRSISAENTYEYDLTDSYAIETALLYLCHTVMFRSLREKVRSKSLTLKIRYNDFTTVSVQSTGDRYVASVDDLFERAKSLFKKKYDGNSGIRLLGIGLQNLEDESTPKQQELFDFGDEKERKLEIAILKAQEKNPALKITKARLLKGSSLILALFLLPLLKIQAETASDKEKEADGAASIVFDTSKLPLASSNKFSSIFNRDFGNQNIEFFASGYWKSTVTGGASYSFGFGSTPAISINTPVFTQNVDLSLYFMLNHHWYFEAAFADEFTKNTVAAGYIGNGYLKSARISNRKIIFPTLYSINDVNRGIGGGDIQAPGISFNWKGEKWQADAAVRYDLVETKEKSWYGKNSLATNNISLSAYNSGNQYILPDSRLVSSIKDIYIESAGGNYRDSKGRKYKKLDSSRYLLVPASNMILISKDAKAYRQNGVLPAIAVTFSISVTQSDFGDYSDDETYLGKIQKWFSSKDPKISVAKYAYSLFSSINGEDSLYLQYPAGFSPFAYASRYDTNSSQASDAQIVYSSSRTTDTNYSAVIDEDKVRFSVKDFFYSNHLYADLSRNDEESSDATENLIRQSFPLAPEHPEIYLGSSRNEDLVLQVRTFTPVKRFDIGTKAVDGTVTVYKNGVIDPMASYNSESGTITLSGAVSSADHIIARWYEESSDSSTGQITGAGGFKYDFTDNLSGDISLTSRWSYSPNRKYADAGFSSAGFLTSATKIAYKGNGFSASNTAAASYENTNTTGNYRILGNEDSTAGSFYLVKKAGINLPQEIIPSLNVSPAIKLAQAKKGSVDSRDGSTDSEISGYAIPFDWNFTGITGEDTSPAWSALTIYTPGVSGSLSNASTFTLALKNAFDQMLFTSGETELYLQLGVSSEKDFSLEEAEKIPTWKISENSNLVRIKDTSSAWKTVTVTLTDEDRSILAALGNTNARLILTSKDTSTIPLAGTIYAGPYETGPLVFNVKSDANIIATNYQTTDPSLTAEKIKSFTNNSSKNHVQFFEWKFLEGQTEKQDIIFTRSFSEVDLENYGKIAFFMKGESLESDSKVTITLYRQKNSEKQKALVYEFHPDSSWKEYSIDTSAGLKDGVTVLNTDIVPSKIEIKINTKNDASISFDELYLSENSPFILLQDKASASYKFKGTILEAGQYALLKDFNISASGSAANSLKTENKKFSNKSLQGSGNIGFTLTNLKITSQAHFTNAYTTTKSTSNTQNNPLASASHSLKTEKPLLGLLSFSENYTFSAEESSLEKENEAKVDFSKYDLPVTLKAVSKSSSDSWALNQSASAELNISPEKLSLSAKTSLSQKILTYAASTSSKGQEKLSTENYASSWQEITKFSFDSGNEKASKRAVAAQMALSYAFTPASLTPKISFETGGDYKASAKITFTDTTKSGFTIPFKINKNNFSFSWTKSGGSTKSLAQGGDYKSDTKELEKSLSEKSYYFKALPLYDMISSDLSGLVYDTNGESSFYTGSYDFTWKRAFFANKYDFFIPQSAKLEASRDIRTASSTSDFYQIKNTVTYNALNIFGKNGNLPVFSFFSSDEYISSFSAIAKIPRPNPEAISFIFSGYIQTTIYFSQSDYIKAGLEGSIEGKEDWKAKYTLVWKRPASSSLAKGIITLFKPDAGEKISRITKSDSLNIATSCTSSSSAITRKYSFAYSHETETQVAKYLSINTGSSLGYSATWEKSAILSASATIGATIKF